MRVRGILMAVALSIIACASYAADDFPFDPAQLEGWWAESYNADEACGFSNLRMKMRFSEDRKRIEMTFDRKWKTELGVMQGFTATVLSATARSIVIRYDNETRLSGRGKPVEWELWVVAPGVYRWRETTWKPGEVNTVVGVRCVSEANG